MLLLQAPHPSPFHPTECILETPPGPPGKHLSALRLFEQEARIPSHHVVAAGLPPQGPLGVQFLQVLHCGQVAVQRAHKVPLGASLPAIMVGSPVLPSQAVCLQLPEAAQNTVSASGLSCSGLSDFTACASAR